MPDVVLSTAPQDGPRFTRATFRPERGLMLAELRAVLADGREVAVVEDAAALPEDDFVGNASFSFGGAFLIPYANRIRGRPGPDRTLIADLDGRSVRLPANWSGKAPGAERYAMHGLILDQTVEVLGCDGTRLTGRLKAGDFNGRWPSSTDLTFDITLEPAALSVVVEARNVGDEPCPIGIGWHPWFSLPSGDRTQARLHVPARARLEVADYDAVLPTGKVLPLAGAPHDFSPAQGRPLGDLYLDDCFVDLQPKAQTVARLEDPASGLKLALKAQAPPVKAVQVYAPTDRAVVVIEPQFNWADSFNPMWADQDTGMALLQPGERVRYACSVLMELGR